MLGSEQLDFLGGADAEFPLDDDEEPGLSAFLEEDSVARHNFKLHELDETSTYLATVLEELLRLGLEVGVGS